MRKRIKEVEILTSPKGENKPAMSIFHYGYLIFPNVEDASLSEPWQAKMGRLPNGQAIDSRYNPFVIENEQDEYVLQTVITILQDINVVNTEEIRLNNDYSGFCRAYDSKEQKRQNVEDELNELINWDGEFSEFTELYNSEKQKIAEKRKELQNELREPLMMLKKFTQTL